jgi:probable HAF family extracellular repeat protein
VFTTIDVPGAFGTFAEGINDAGEIVGEFSYPPDVTGQGFLDDAGTFSIIDVPGGLFTAAQGINNKGEIVGYYSSASGTEGFIDDGGVFTSLEVPGAADTFATGINDNGQVVGYFINSSGQREGFLATPTPEPGNQILVGIGLLGLVVKYRRRAKFSRSFLSR